jgi:hypothetical protein
MNDTSSSHGSMAAFDALMGLLAGLAWGVARNALGTGDTEPSGILAALGAPMAVAVPLVFVVRRARPFPRSLVALALGAGLAAVPLAVFGAVLVDQTHHRALGGLTFAALALLAIVLGWLLSLRLLPRERVLARSGSQQGTQLGGTGLLAVSGAAALVLLAVLVGASATRSAAAGVCAIVCAVWVPGRRVPPVVGVIAGVAAVLVSVAAAL